MRPSIRAAAALLLLACASARAGTRQDAKAHFDEGKAQFQLADYARALDEFQQAYRLAPIPDILYNIARCHEHLNNLAAAVRAYEQYAATLPPSPERTAAEERIVALRASLPAEPPPERGEPPPQPAAEPAAQPPPPLAAPPAPVEPSILRRWWLWTAIAVVLVGAGVGIAVGLAGSTPMPMLDFPPLAAQP